MKKLNKEDYKICIFGLRYVGIPLATRFLQKGFDVTDFVYYFRKLNKIS